MDTKNKLAKLAYDTYCEAVGGVAFNGDPLPSWEDFSKDENKQKQVEAWRTVAERVYPTIATTTLDGLKQPITIEASAFYLLVIKDADGVNHFWNPDGSYDGHCRPVEEKPQEP